MHCIWIFIANLKPNVSLLIHKYGKGSLTLESFLHLPTNVSIHYREHYPSKEKILRIVILHIFWRMDTFYEIRIHGCTDLPVFVFILQ